MPRPGRHRPCQVTQEAARAAQEAPRRVQEPPRVSQEPSRSTPRSLQERAKRPLKPILKMPPEAPGTKMLPGAPHLRGPGFKCPGRRDSRMRIQYSYTVLHDLQALCRILWDLALFGKASPPPGWCGEALCPVEGEL